MHLISAHTGTPHVTANDLAHFWAGAFDPGDYYLPAHGTPTATITGNTVQLSSMALSIQGYMVLLDGTETVTV